MIDKVQKEKYLAAEKAISYIKSGMIVGLGSGSTAEIAVKILAKKIKSNTLKDIIGVPSSTTTKQLAEKEGISLITNSVPSHIDITIDGADAFDNNLQLIKGGGGALLHEKIVASASEILIIIVDSRKKATILGTTFNLPIEVISLASEVVTHKLQKMGAKTQLRQKMGETFISDEGNYILDCHFGAIENPRDLAIKVSQIAGVVEHGLFIDMTNMIIVGEGENTHLLKMKHT